MRELGNPVALAGGVPDGLTAHAWLEMVDTVDGERRPRTDRRGRPRVDRVVLLATDPSSSLPTDTAHGPARRALAASSRLASSRGPGSRDLAVALARAGAVVLHAPTRANLHGLIADGWTHWERTDLGVHWAATYDSVGHDPVDGHAAAVADQITGGTPEAWLAEFHRTRDTTANVLRRARDLVADRTCAGWSLSRFAASVTGDTHGLDIGAPLATLVLRDLANDLVPGLDPTADAHSRAELLHAAGLGADALASFVACSRVPGGVGPAADLLAAAADHDMPALLPRVALLTGTPVAPPRAGSPGWVFAVENEGALTEAHQLGTDAPVVWHGSLAAALLLDAAAEAGWRMAVSADFEPGGLRRAAWLLERLGPAGVPWRLGVAEYERTVAEGGGLGARALELPFTLPGRFAALETPMQTRLRRITEEDRLGDLLDDIRAGSPGGA